MSQQDNGRMSTDNDAAEQSLRRLFAHAQARPAPPAEDEAEVRRAVYAEWEALTGRRALWRRAGAAAVAAVALTVASVWMLQPVSGPVGPAMATVERVAGTVTAQLGRGGETLQLGDAVAGRVTVATGSGEIALRLTRGGSLRLAPQSRLEFANADAAELQAGTVYFDSENGSSSGQPFTITTPFGVVRDVGTQFLARVARERLDVGVREGRIAVERGDLAVGAGAGERISVPERGADVQRDTLETFGDEWAWADRLAPPFAIDGRSLLEFLEWVARQTGRTLVFEDPAAERTARETILVGSIDLPPTAKLAAVLATTELGYALDGRSIVIAFR